MIQNMQFITVCSYSITFSLYKLGICRITHISSLVFLTVSVYPVVRFCQEV
jgi:hypothetical protein